MAQLGTGQHEDRNAVRKDTHNTGPALDLSVPPINGVTSSCFELKHRLEAESQISSIPCYSFFATTSSFRSVNRQLVHEKSNLLKEADSILNFVNL